MLPPHLHIFLHYLGIGTGFESFDNILASFYYRSHKTAFIDRKHLLEIGNHGLQFRLGVGSLAIFHKLRSRAGMERYMIGIGIKLGVLDEQELLAMIIMLIEMRIGNRRALIVGTVCVCFALFLCPQNEA